MNLLICNYCAREIKPREHVKLKAWRYDSGDNEKGEGFVCEETYDLHKQCEKEMTKDWNGGMEVKNDRQQRRECS